MGNPVSALLELLGSKSDVQAVSTQRTRRIGKLNELERVALYKYIGSRVRAGHAVGAAMQKLLGSEYIRKTSRMKAAIEVAIHKFSRGAKLAVALQAFIPSMEYMLILTGDQSGSLPDTLAQLSDSIIRDRKMRRSFRKSLVPSFMLLIFGVLAIFATALFIVPQYRGVLKPNEVHGFAAFVLATSTPTGLASLVALVLGSFTGLIWFTRAARTVDAPWRRWLENIPNSPLAFYRDWNSLLWIRMHLIMLRAGVMERDALALSIKSATPWLARRLMKVKQYIERDGKRLPEALISTYASTNFPAPLLIEEIAQSGDAADISGALEKALAVWEGEFVESAETSLRVFSGIIRFLVIALLFGIAGSIVSLVLGAMHQSLAGASLY
ncbi:type II secretion system protein [mine drainage metagenome]|uniref:Type II secretion system protein n=1 Tax=mine drainage metagenome TaxID=410659 RepID=T0ZHP5_9ZZZZ